MTSINTQNYYFLLIVSPSGSQVYSKILNSEVTMTGGELMQIAPMLFTIHDISKLAKPDAVKMDDLEEGFEDVLQHRLHFVTTPKFKIHFFTSLTNLRLILVTDPKLLNCNRLFSRIYSGYSDYVSKDASYAANQPIKSQPFDQEIAKIFSDVN